MRGYFRAPHRHGERGAKTHGSIFAPAASHPEPSSPVAGRAHPGAPKGSQIMTEDNGDRPAIAGAGSDEVRLRFGALAQRERGAAARADLRAKAARETCPFLTAKEAAFYLGLAVISLRGLRRKGTGPKCRKHGRDWRYHIDDLEAWSLSNSVGGGHD